MPSPCPIVFPQLTIYQPADHWLFNSYVPFRYQTSYAISVMLAVFISIEVTRIESKEEESTITKSNMFPFCDVPMFSSISVRNNVSILITASEACCSSINDELRCLRWFCLYCFNFAKDMHVWKKRRMIVRSINNFIITHKTNSYSLYFAFSKVSCTDDGLEISGFWLCHWFFFLSLQLSLLKTLWIGVIFTYNKHKHAPWLGFVISDKEISGGQADICAMTMTAHNAYVCAKHFFSPIVNYSYVNRSTLEFFSTARKL